VFDRWKRLGIQPALGCSDEVFLRRAFIDAIGTLPTADESSQFLADRDPAKRAALIDRLLDRDEFADYWAMRWSELLRVKSEFPINIWPNAVQAYYRWIHTAVAHNLPYDQFARALLVANGSNFRVPEVNFYRAVQSKEALALAQAVALTFMGERAGGWIGGMAGFFSRVGYKSTDEWKEEIVYFDPTKKAPAGLAFPDGKPAHLEPGQDPRVVFADWLIQPQNPWFARNIVNRVWYWLLGRGIVHEPDDIRPENPPANPELLAYLQQELIGAHYDLKHIYRLILNSQVYQMSSLAPDGASEAGAAQFAWYPSGGWTRKCSSTPSARSRAPPKSTRALFPSRSRSCRRASAPSDCPTAAFRARFWTFSDGRRAIPGWLRSATTLRRRNKLCTCSTPAIFRTRSSKAPSCRR
jgi:hypothetical protein